MSEGTMSFEPKDLKTAEIIINKKYQDYINFLRSQKVSPSVVEALGDDDMLMRNYDVMIEKMIEDFCRIMDYKEPKNKHKGTGVLYIYGAKGCVACDSRVSQLDTEGVNYKYIDIDTLTNSELKELGSKYGTKLPIEVFYEDLK